MSTAAYVVASLAWAVFGFVVGWLLGRSWVALERIDRKILMPVHENEVGELRRRLRRPSGAQVLGAVLVVLAVASVITVTLQTVRLNDVTSCQAEWNDSYQAALRQRADAAATERAAQRELLTLMLQQPTRQEARAALHRYLESLEDADNEREDARIPKRACN